MSTTRRSRSSSARRKSKSASQDSGKPLTGFIKEVDPGDFRLASTINDLWKQGENLIAKADEQAIDYTALVARRRNVMFQAIRDTATKIDKIGNPSGSQFEKNLTALMKTFFEYRIDKKVDDRQTIITKCAEGSKDLLVQHIFLTQDAGTSVDDTTMESEFKKCCESTTTLAILKVDAYLFPVFFEKKECDKAAKNSNPGVCYRYDYRRLHQPFVRWLAKEAKEKGNATATELLKLVRLREDVLDLMSKANAHDEFVVNGSTNALSIVSNHGEKQVFDPKSHGYMGLTQWISKNPGENIIIFVKTYVGGESNANDFEENMGYMVHDIEVSLVSRNVVFKRDHAYHRRPETQSFALTLHTIGLATTRSVMARLPRYNICDSYRDLQRHRLGDLGLQYPMSYPHNDIGFSGAPDISRLVGQAYYRLHARRFVDHQFMNLFFDKDTYLKIAASDKKTANIFYTQAVLNEGQTDIMATNYKSVFCENRILGLVLLTQPDTLVSGSIEEDLPQIQASRIRNYEREQRTAAFAHALSEHAN